MRPPIAVRVMGEPEATSPAAPAAAMSSPLRSRSSRSAPEPTPARSALAWARAVAGSTNQRAGARYARTGTGAPAVRAIERWPFPPTERTAVQPSSSW